MATVFTSDTNPFETNTVQSETTTISQESMHVDESGAVSDSESVASVSSNSSNSGKKKLKIKTKKRSNSSDSSIDSAEADDSSTTKKPRKARTTKPNELEKYGFNPELTWNFPKMKKYLDDEGRTCVKTIDIVKSTKSCDHYEEHDDETIGIHITFRKGVKEESVLFITKFEPDWLKDTAFSNYINSFSGKSSKSSRLVIIHSSAKAWGAKKVTEALEKIKELEAATKLASIPGGNYTINFSGPDNNTSTEITEQPTLTVPPAPKKLSAKTMGSSIDFNEEFSRLTKQFQEQMEIASRNYQMELAKLTMAVAQSTV